MRNVSRRQVLGGIATVCVTGTAGCALNPDTVTETETRQVSADGDRLAVSNELGGVRIRGEERSDIMLKITREAPEDDLDRLAVTVDQGTRIDIAGSVTDEQTLQNDFGLSLDLELAVPRELAVVEADVTAGDVTVRETTGDLTASSTAGEIDVRDVSGFVTVETTAGGATVRNVDGIGGAEATAGDLDLTVPAIDGRTTVESTAGEIELALSSDLDAEIYAEATSGDVTVSELSVSGSDDSVRGTLGDGGPMLTVEATSGDVRLHQAE